MTDARKPNLSPQIVGTSKKQARGLCTWEQMHSGFDEPVGSCMEKATHVLHDAHGKPWQGFEGCEYHVRIWDASKVYGYGPLPQYVIRGEGGAVFGPHAMSRAKAEWEASNLTAESGVKHVAELYTPPAAAPDECDDAACGVSNMPGECATHGA